MESNQRFFSVFIIPCRVLSFLKFWDFPLSLTLEAIALLRSSYSLKQCLQVAALAEGKRAAQERHESPGRQCTQWVQAWALGPGSWCSQVADLFRDGEFSLSSQSWAPPVSSPSSSCSLAFCQPTTDFLQVGRKEMIMETSSVGNTRKLAK